MYNILMKLDEIEARISFLGELVSINSPISLWSFDNNGTLYWTNSASLTYNLIFTNSDSFSYMKKYFEEGNRKPIILSNHSGLIWGATAYFSEDKLQSYHVAGPILTQVKSDESLRKEISKKTNNSFSMDKMVKAIQSLPIMSINSFLSILLMLHYTVEGEKLSTSDVMMQHPEEAKDDTLTPLSNNQNDRLIIYHSEKTILDMIRNGHLDKKEVTKAASAFTGTQMYSENSLQHAKLSRALFVGQAAKAAIEGGISTDLAYTRQDMYMRDLDSAKSISEINVTRVIVFHMPFQSISYPFIHLAVQTVYDFGLGDSEISDKNNISEHRLSDKIYYLSELFTVFQSNSYLSTKPKFEFRLKYILPFLHKLPFFLK